MHISNKNMTNFYFTNNQEYYIATNEVWDDYTNKVKSSPEVSLLKKVVLKKIEKYILNNFKHKSKEVTYYSTTGYIIEGSKTTKQLEDIYESIKELNKNINHYDILIIDANLCDIAVIFYCTEPNDEEYNSKFASNYFDVDDVWLNEIRFLK